VSRGARRADERQLALRAAAHCPRSARRVDHRYKIRPFLSACDQYLVVRNSSLRACMDWSQHLFPLKKRCRAANRGAFPSEIACFPLSFALSIRDATTGNESALHRNALENAVAVIVSTSSTSGET
jgi:hypothetical protein